ncbi:O-antigen ligase family protein [bacterium]|nr:O-antigen ligase family protein [bacterium]
MSQKLYWGLAILVGLLVCFPAFLAGKAAAVLVLGTLLLGVFAWLLLAFDQDRFSQMGFGPALLLFLFISIITVMASTDPASSINPFSTEISMLLVFLLAYLLARQMRTVRPVLAGLLGLGIILAAYGFLQHIQGMLDTYQHFFGQTPPENRVEQEIANRLLSRRAFSLFTYPNLLAGFIALLLPLGFSFMLTTRRRGLGWLWGAGVVVMVMGLYVTGSVGGWLAAVAGIGMFFFLIQRKIFQDKKTAMPWSVWIAGALLAVSGAVILILVRNPESFFNDIITRLANWGSAFRMGWDHSLTGVGPGLFGVVFPDYQTENGYYVRYAHNFLLQRFSETGLLGLTALLWFLFTLTRQACQSFGREMMTNQRLYIIAVFSGVTAVFLHACIDLDLNFVKTSVLFWFLLGSGLGLVAPKKNTAEPIQIPYERLLRLGLAGIGVMVLWKGGKSLPVEGLLYIGTGLLLVLFFIGRTDNYASWWQLMKRIPLRWPLSIFMVWAILSAMVSLHPAGAIPGMTLAASGLLLYMLTVLTPRTGHYLIRTAGAAAVIIALVALSQMIFQPGMRVDVQWPNPNLLAAFFAMGLLVNIITLIFSARTNAERMGSALGVLIVFFAMLATGSMGAVLNSIAGLGVILFWIKVRKPRYFKFVALVFGLFLILAIVLPFQTGGRLLDLKGYKAQTYERVQILKSSSRMIFHRPVTGFGPGNFSQAFERYSFPNIRGLSRFGKIAQFAHNEPIQLMVVTGIPGGLLLVWISWILLIHFRRQSRAPVPLEGTVDASEQVSRIAAWSVLAGAAVHGLVDFNWHLPGLFIWYMMLLGIAVAPMSRWRTEENISLLDIGAWRSRLGKLCCQPFPVLLVLVVIAISLASIRPLVSHYLQNLGEAQRYKQDLKAADREFQRALSVHPLSSKAYDALGQIRVDFYAMVGSETWFRLSDWAFQKAYDLNGMNAYIHRHMGGLYKLKAAKSLGEEKAEYYDRAERQYLLGIEKAPQKALLYFELGNLLRDAGRMDSAERAWREAIALEPNYAAAHSNLGVALEIRDELIDAEKSYRRALDVKVFAAGAEGKYELELLTLNWAVVHSNLGHLYEQQARWIEAYTEYKKVLVLEPENALAQKRLENLQRILP